MARDSAKALREQRAKLIEEGRKLQETAERENRAKTAEERERWDKIFGGVVEGKRVKGEEEILKERIDDAERVDRLQDEMESRVDRGNPDRVPGRDTQPGAGGGAVTVSEVTRCLALQGWVRAQRGMPLRQEHEDALRETGIRAQSPELVLNLRGGDYHDVRAMTRRHAAGDGLEFRAGANAAQAISLAASGGAIVPEGFVNRLEVALLQFGGIRKVAEVMRTTSGQDLPWPTVNDTTVKGSILSENTAVTGSDMTFGKIVLHAYKYTSGLVLVPVELMEDAAFQLAPFLGNALGMRIGRIQSDHFTTGTGAAQPTGCITAATTGVTSAVATALTADDIYTLKHQVDPAYRELDPSFMMHDLILLALKKLKDGMGRYLWQTSLAGGAPDTLDGDPIVINQSMDSTLASGKKVMSYGAHSKYIIRDVSEVRLRRLVERYADADQEGFVMFARADGNLLDAGTHPVKIMLQP